MSPSPNDILQHIVDEADFLLAQSASISLDEFLHDAVLKRAFVRSLEIVGEAVGKLPDDLKRKQSQIDWRAMSAMRNRLIHGYFGVDYEIVWDVVVSKVAELRAAALLALEEPPETDEVHGETPTD
jgi:uncharacterized protein with HEPN domain